MTTNVYTSLEQLETIRTAWDELAIQADHSNFFFSFSYFKSFILGFGTTRVHVLVMSEGEKILGIVPTYLADDNHLVYLGNLDVTDYGGIIASATYLPQVLAAATEWCRTHSVTQLLLHSVQESSLTYNYCIKIDQKDIKAYITQQEVCPIIQLPTSFEQYLEALNRKQRHEARRKMKKLAFDHPYSVRVVSSELSNADVDTFITLHKSSSADKAAFWTANKKEFFVTLLKESARDSHLKLFFLDIENKSVASMLVFDYQNNYYLYNAGYLKDAYPGYSTGQVLLLEVIKTAIEQEKKVFDFLRGNEEYKFRLGATAQPIYDIALSLPLGR